MYPGPTPAKTGFPSPRRDTPVTASSRPIPEETFQIVEGNLSAQAAPATTHPASESSAAQAVRPPRSPKSIMERSAIERTFSLLAGCARSLR